MLQIYYTSTVYDNYHLDGLICIGKFDLNLASKLKEHSSNIVFLDSNPDERRFSSVVSDLKGSTHRIMAYLKDKGHRHVGFIGGSEYLGLTKEIYLDARERTFRHIVSDDKDISSNEGDIYIDDYKAPTGYNSIFKAFEKKKMPTAFVCGSDTIAMGALSALGELNQKLQEPVSIISYNNIPSSEFLNPSLTTIAIDTKYMGELAANLVILNINSKNVLPIKIVCQTELVERESVYQR